MYKQMDEEIYSLKKYRAFKKLASFFSMLPFHKACLKTLRTL